MNILQRMAIFARVVELGAFNRAARELGVTTSSVSQHVRGLEQALGAVLLHRSTRKLSLTEAGTMYYEECVNLVRAAERGRQKVAALRDQLAGELRISAPAGLAHRHLALALHDFIAAHPDLSIRFEVGDEKIDLIEQRIDLAVRVGDLSDSRMVARQIAWLDEVVCAAPAYLLSVPMPQSPQALAELEWLIFSPLGEPAFVELHHQDGREVRLRIRGRLTANLADTLKALALGGHGVSRLLRIDAQDELAQGKLIELLPEWQLQGFGAYAITPRRDDAQPLKVTRCIDHLRTYFKGLSGHGR